MNNKFIFTGGPCSGKTTIINKLKQLGFKCSTEVGRKIIKDQVKNNKDALPWINKQAFRDKMAAAELNNYNLFKDTKTPVFFDRSIIDCVGYSHLEGLSIPENLYNLCKTLKYNQHVFIFPPWESIFENDTERKQSYSEAVNTYSQMVKSYGHFGYDLTEVPKIPVTQRVNFILETIKNFTAH